MLSDLADGCAAPTGRGATTLYLSPTKALAADQLARIFDYGVSDAEPQDGVRRGQGLFVAKTYLAKMGGSIAARNVADGVVFEIALRRA